ncbi:MAG: indolepyruvate oxidoreductase subunit beta [Rhodospirillales bacterium]|nr:indolepyruvate oxidoreductase subunit beta [Rhodospirillales bacterium]
MSGTAFKTTDVLVVGIGGQGVLTATEVLAEAAIELGYDVKKTEVAGMAQRGGMVTSHLRFGEKVMAPAIAPGSADVMIAFEAAEALRCSPFLRPGGIAIVNTQEVIPPVVSTGLFKYPDDPVGEMRARGVRLLALDAAGIARTLGDPRLANSAMLGAAAEHLPFGADLLLRMILRRFSTKRPELADINARAFEAGRRAVQEQGLAAAG